MLSGGSSLPSIVAFKNPMEMPAFAFESPPGIYNQNTFTSSTNSYFWDCLDGDGAYIAGSTSADTYVTVIDVSGRGYLGNVILYQTQSNGLDATITVKFTVDGVEYIRELMYDSTGGHYLFLGANNHLGLSDSSTYTDDHASMYRLSVSHLDQSTDGSVCRVKSTNCAFHSPFKYIAMGIPVLAFETDLKVEVKSSIRTITSGHTKNVGVTMNYVVDGA